MNKYAIKWMTRIIVFVGALSISAASIIYLLGSDIASMSNQEIMLKIIMFPIVAASVAVGITFGGGVNAVAAAGGKAAPKTLEEIRIDPFAAQVIGLQWLNPLQRRDYPTEWQLLWTMGLAKPNKNDDLAIIKPKLFSSPQSIGIIAYSNNGTETFKGFNHKYIRELTTLFHDAYYSNSKYFYNVHSKEGVHWRELAGIHVEYAIPSLKLDPVEAGSFLAKELTGTFSIGNTSFPTLWSRSTPPDVHTTPGGPNAGFISLALALDYLQAHPAESAWVMNWDAPNFPKDAQTNENMVLLVLAGPDYDTERDPLAWIGYPATTSVADFAPANKGQSPRAVQAWKAAIDAATRAAGKQDTDIGFVIHDANNTQPNSSERLGTLAQTLTVEMPEFDFMKQTFNTPALLGEMGAGTALTNVALAIAYANHMGKNVLVAGTSDVEHPTAVMVVPPAKVRPIDPDKDWFRARGGDSIFLPWWGRRHDATFTMQGYSE